MRSSTRLWEAQSRYGSAEAITRPSLKLKTAGQVSLRNIALTFSNGFTGLTGAGRASPEEQVLASQSSNGQSRPTAAKSAWSAVTMAAVRLAYICRFLPLRRSQLRSHRQQNADRGIAERDKNRIGEGLCKDKLGSA